LGGFRRVNTDGQRNEIPLTDEQKEQAKVYAVSLGMPEDMIFFLDNFETGYGTTFDDLVIGTDVLPRHERSKYPNDNVSLKGTIAHEIIGHRDAAIGGFTHPVDDLEETQASIRAARFAPNLSRQERMDLLRDAISRLKPNEKRPYTIRLLDVKNQLRINER
jgi:hypothetical protein